LEKEVYQLMELLPKLRITQLEKGIQQSKDQITQLKGEIPPETQKEIKELEAKTADLTDSI